MVRKSKTAGTVGVGYVQKIIAEKDTLQDIARELAKFVADNCHKRLLKDQKLLHAVIEEAVDDPTLNNKLIDQLCGSIEELKTNTKVDPGKIIDGILRTPDFQNALQKALREEIA